MMKKRLTHMLVYLSVIACIIYFSLSLIGISNEIEQIFKIGSALLLTLFTISFAIFNAMYLKKDKCKFIPINVANITLILFISLNIVHDTGLINLPAQKTIENFSNNNVAEVLKWAAGNQIEIEQVYEYSDSVPMYHIISQDVESGTLVKEVKKLRIVISNGPDYNKNVVVPNMMGYTADETLKFIQDNLLNNVDVSFISSDNPRHTLVEQSYSGDMKRNEKLSLVLSLGKEDEQTPYTMVNFSNKSMFEAIYILKMYGLKYEINHEFSDQVLKGNVIGQSINEGEEIEPNATVSLVISKGKTITVPNILNEDLENVVKWIMDNRLAVKFQDRYDDQVEMGKIIECNLKEGDKIEEGTQVILISSKGSLKMKEYTTLDEYKEWFEKYNIKYEIKYEINEEVVENSIIKTSHKNNDVIKNNDTVIIYASKGGLIAVPNFKNLSKYAASSKCSDLGLKCTYVDGTYSNNVSKGIVTNQSVAAGKKVEKGTSVKITLSKGPATYMPNFVGKSKTSIQSECNSKNLSCSFVTGSFSNTVNEGIATKQSINSGVQVTSGAKVTITLSKGPAAVYKNVVISSSLFGTAPTASATETAIKSFLNSKCPGLKVNFVRKAHNTISGIIHPDSAIKADQSYTFTEGNTITITIAQ